MTNTHETACGTCGWQDYYPSALEASNAVIEHARQTGHTLQELGYDEISQDPNYRSAEEVLVESIEANMSSLEVLLDIAREGEPLATRHFEALLALREATSIAADLQASHANEPRELTAWESGEPTRPRR